ncbi:MAG: T9SS type A sorting domain-containing protein [Bacteroidota bacterium]
MYFPFQSARAFLYLVFCFFSIGFIHAQEASCVLSPPGEVFVSEQDAAYELEWEDQEAATSYRVIVVDTESSDILFSETVEQASVNIVGLSFTAATYVGIASVCENGDEGNYGYFGPEFNSTIIVQDIVMQMQGEDDPRTLECETETEQLIAASVSGFVHTNFNVIPPVNGASGHQIQGALVDIKLVEQGTGNVFARSTMLTHANNTLTNSNTGINVTNTGSNYDFINPSSQHFFSYSNPNQGQFDFWISAALPGDQAYQLMVEQRNCPNVNKIVQTRSRGGHGLRSGGEGAWKPSSFIMKRVELTDELTIYPNPTTNQVILTIPTQEVNVFDSQGQLLFQAVNTSPQQTIYVSDWPAGTYFVQAITTEGEAIARPFQKL